VLSVVYKTLPIFKVLQWLTATALGVRLQPFQWIGLHTQGKL